MLRSFFGSREKQLLDSSFLYIVNVRGDIMAKVSKLDQVVEVNPALYRPLAFFGINIEQDDDNIIEWVRWCKRQGFGGFNIIVGSDCEGRAHDAWIEKLLHAYEVALRTAKEEGLEVWIFDDWGYPSGTAGGLVCTNPDYRIKRLDIVYDCMVEPGSSVTVTVPERFVAAGVLSGRDYQPLKLTPGEEFTYTAEERSARLVIVGWNYDPHQAKSNCKSYPGDPAMSCIDMLNPMATRRFIEVMHERYFQRLEPYMGDVVKGFFYDEPFVQHQHPWTEKLPEVFKAKKGYDLLEILPELLVKMSHPRGHIVKYIDDFFDVWTDMVAENYYGELSRWCEQHGLELSGHLDLDHHYNTMFSISGHLYKNLRHNHRPAVDVIWAQIAPGEYSDFPRFAGSVKHLWGRERATTETFAGMGLGLSGDLMRFITDHEVVRGINDFHLMYSSNKPPAHEKSPQMPNHMLQEPFGRLIYERMAAATAVGSLGEAAITTALYIPAFDINRAQQALKNVGITNAERLPWQWVADIAQHLTYMPVDFCYLWQEALFELDIDSGGLRTKGGQIIDTIIIPPGTTMDESVVEKLIQFAENGGKLITVFKPAWPLMNHAVMCNQVKDLTELLDREIEVDTRGTISLATRKLEDYTLYLLLNEDDRGTDALIRFKEGAVYEVSLPDFCLSPVAVSGSQVELEFAPMQLRVFLLDHSCKLTLADVPQVDAAQAVIPVNWEIALPDGTSRSLSGDEFPCWAELGFPGYSGDLVYTAEFEWSSSAEKAVISAPELYSHAEFFIDDQLVGKMAYRPYEIEISGLTPGKHELKVKVYNTEANLYCGTLEIEKERYHGRFAHLAHYDRRRLTSGLLRPVEIVPVLK